MIRHRKLLHAHFIVGIGALLLALAFGYYQLLYLGWFSIALWVMVEP